MRGGGECGGGFFLSNWVFISCDLSRRRAVSANDLAFCALSFLTRHIYDYNIVVFIGRSFLGTSRSAVLSPVK